MSKVSFELKHCLNTIFASTGGASKKERNFVEVEDADKQYAQAGKQKEEVDCQVRNAQLDRVGVGDVVFDLLDSVLDDVFGRGVERDVGAGE